MNTQNKILGSLLFSTVLLLGVACGDDTNTGGNNTGGNGGEGAGNPDGAGPAGGGGNDGGGGNGGDPFVIPPKPGLGDQIDRMGRPAINTALQGAFITFDGAGNPAASDDAVRAGLEDTYNENANPAMWTVGSINLFKANLAIIDSLDAFVTSATAPTNAQSCRNQPACGNLLDPTDNVETDEDCYATLGLALTQDMLFVDTAGEDCSAADPTAGLTNPIVGYLAVEFNAFAAILGVPTLANTGCGGRRPIDDVIDVTYGTLVFANPAGFGDNIDEVAGTHPELFPYMDAP